ncbi:MAG: hypothetical protein ACJAYY_001940 [Paraglaciecola sp.]|jgi:hypothetical protein
MCGWSSKEEWSFFYFILLLIFTISLYLLTDFLIPKNVTSTTNLKEYFLDNRKMFFGIQIFTLIVDVIETSLLEIEGIRDMPFE